MPKHNLWSALAATISLIFSIHLHGQQDNILPELGNGIAAIAEGKIITVEQLRREIEPIVPRLRTQARTEEEFAKSIGKVSREILQNLINRNFVRDNRAQNGIWSGLLPRSNQKYSTKIYYVFF